MPWQPRKVIGVVIRIAIVTSIPRQMKDLLSLHPHPPSILWRRWYRNKTTRRHLLQVAPSTVLRLPKVMSHLLRPIRAHETLNRNHLLIQPPPLRNKLRKLIRHSQQESQQRKQQKPRLWGLSKLSGKLLKTAQMGNFQLGNSLMGKFHLGNFLICTNVAFGK